MRFGITVQGDAHFADIFDSALAVQLLNDNGISAQLIGIARITARTLAAAILRVPNKIGSAAFIRFGRRVIKVRIARTHQTCGVIAFANFTESGGFHHIGIDEHIAVKTGA